jgi:hypothetical protein
MAAILQPDYNRRMNVTRQPLRSISLVVYKGVQMLDVAGPLYEDADLTNEPIAQRCGFGEPDTAASLFTTLRCRPAEYRSRFHSSHPLRAESASSKQ